MSLMLVGFSSFMNASSSSFYYDRSKKNYLLQDKATEDANFKKWVNSPASTRQKPLHGYQIVKHESLCRHELALTRTITRFGKKS